MIVLKRIQIVTIQELRNALQTAIQLEHSTIPPYLTANFTLHNTGNDEIVNLIGSILGEEMLHLSIACNILNAIGGSPVLNQPGFIPTYPGYLPGGVDSSLVVPLAKFSKDLVKNVFMEIEQPEDPIDIKLMTFRVEGMTIGEYYEHIKVQIEQLENEANAKGETIFTGDLNKQMTYTKFFPEKLLFPITDKATAFEGIDIIVDQGEGSTTDPFVNPDGTANGVTPEPAHYYRFEEIYKGKKLVKDPSAKVGYSYSGAVIPFDETHVPNMKENPKMKDYPTDSLAYVNCKLFNYTYTNLLQSLHDTFNGAPQQINEAMGLMFSLRLYALKLLTIPDPNNPGYVAGPSFEFVSGEALTEEEKEQFA